MRESFFTCTTLSTYSNYMLYVYIYPHTYSTCCMHDVWMLHMLLVPRFLHMCHFCCGVTFVAHLITMFSMFIHISSYVCIHVVCVHVHESGQIHVASFFTCGLYPYLLCVYVHVVCVFMYVCHVACMMYGCCTCYLFLGFYTLADELYHA